MKPIKMTKRTHAGLLDNVPGVGVVSRQPSRQVVGRIEVRQDGLFKTAYPIFVPAHSSIMIPIKAPVYSRNNPGNKLKPVSV